mmetsp:Transcript_1124/g.1866  ORF Transcript_1124/g.1866 Transcript_1124/m.1866 type:complete len:87 (-) Transcript_1124:905-1165(-)|eukprot:CAMPEP_0184311386 /NCGR_PEP_ID=MMETSP1049-20130417/41859_1 /TAXON_ID=77928 /ORGANISM="Proteomonas sulcata, Strain CCMP704" /LENGTH=86 /DNA_ID=CAMNT_0026626737 /DNA_START=95 /DNA_END=355 /DNA_ORIENTATION=-
MFEILSVEHMPPPPPAGKCYVMPFPSKYGLPPMCVEGQTPDSAGHVGAVMKHMEAVAASRKNMGQQFQMNGASALAARWRHRVGYD